MINFTVVIITGAIVGFVVSMIIRTGNSILFDIFTGIMGGFAAWCLFSETTFNSSGFALSALVSSLLGAAFLLVVFKLVFRRIKRPEKIERSV